MIRAVIFDFDGVILESASIKTDAFVELFAHLQPEQQAAVRDHHLRNLGISRYRKFEWIYENLLGREITDDESRELGEQFSALVFEKVLAAPFVPGAAEALDALSEQLPLFVASGTPQPELDRVVAARQLAPAFREVWGSPTEKPAIIADVCARHDIAHADALFIGDGMSDYRAATAAGTQFLARDTPELHDKWIELGVRLAPDLVGLPATIGSWP